MKHLRTLFEILFVIAIISAIFGWSRVEACDVPTAIDMHKTQVHSVSLITTPFEEDDFGNVSYNNWRVLYHACGGGVNVYVFENVRSVITLSGETETKTLGLIRAVMPYHDPRT